MFVRNIALGVIILCLVSLFVGVPFAKAHSDTGTGILREPVRQRDNAYDERDEWLKEYDRAKEIVEALLGEWTSNEESIKDNSWSTVNTALATLIAELIRNTNNDDGKSTTQQVMEALPTILGTFNAIKEGTEWSTTSAKRDDYLLALSTAVSVFDAVISENQSAFNTYESKYDVYVDKMQNHGGGLARVANHSSSGNYSNTSAWSLSTIKSTVKDKDAYNADVSKNMLEFWYHVNDLKSTSHPSVFGFDRFKDFSTFWQLDALPKKYACGGDCGQKYQTPVENLVICPYPLTSSVLQAGNRRLTGLPIDTPLPKGKASPAGSGAAYYLCSISDRNAHKVRICGRGDANNKCGEPYRNCTNGGCQFGNFLSKKHKEKAGSLIINPLNNLFNAAPGDSHTSELVASAAYSSVKWYVAAPGVSGRGTLLETDVGNGNKKKASFSYTFPSGTSGDYVITAVVYDWSDSSLIDEASYTVSVSGSTSTPASPTLSPSDGSYTASAGGTHTAEASVPSGYHYVYWYIAGPTDTGLGTNIETDTGGGSSTSASFSWSVPSDASGNYVITAYTYLSDWSVVEPSYTVSVSSGGSSTPAPAPTPTPAPTPPSTPPSVSLVPGDASYTARVGDTPTAQLTLGAAPSSITWYIQHPWESSPGTLMSQDTSGSLTSQFAFSLSNAGDHVISVSGTWASDGSAFTASYSVYVTQ